MSYVMTFGGFVLLFAGGELLVRGAVAVARRLGISPMLVGMTVVAFATSAPELLVSVQSALGGVPELAIGNVVGSNICNIGLILGLSAALRPMRIDRHDVRRDTIMMLLSMGLLGVLGAIGVIGRLTGVLMVLVLVWFIVYSYRRELAEGTAHEDWHTEETQVYSDVQVTTTVGLLLVAVGLALLVSGAQLLITGAVQIARSVGVPDWVVGLTIVAIGTSLPELATSVVAVVKGHADVAVGNVLGSNTFNVLLILGTTAAIRPIAILERIAYVDIPVMLAFTVVAVVPLLRSGRISRVRGALLTAAYVSYNVVLYLT